MRVWFFPIEEMSDAWLLGQHREWHLLEAMMRMDRFKSHPLVLFFADKKPWLAKFHDDLVAEMWYRFQTTNPTMHKTPIPHNFNVGITDWEPTEELMAFDRRDANQRFHLEPHKHKWTKREMPEYFETRILGFEDIGQDLYTRLLLTTDHLPVI